MPNLHFQNVFSITLALHNKINKIYSFFLSLFPTPIRLHHRIHTLSPSQHDRLSLVLPLEVVPGHVQSQCVVHEELLLEDLWRRRLQLLQRLTESVALFAHLLDAQRSAQDDQGHLYKRKTQETSID